MHQHPQPARDLERFVQHPQRRDGLRGDVAAAEVIVAGVLTTARPAEGGLAQAAQAARKLHPRLDHRLAGVHREALAGSGARALFDQAGIDHLLQPSVRRGIGHAAGADQRSGRDRLAVQMPLQQVHHHAQVRVWGHEVERALKLVAEGFEEGQDLHGLRLRQRCGGALSVMSSHVVHGLRLLLDVRVAVRPIRRIHLG